VDLCFAIQPELRGTGASARCGLQQIPNNFSGPVLLIYGDLPLVTSSTLAAFCSAHRMSGASLSLITVKLEDPAEYGRVVRDQSGKVRAIVEARDASQAERAIKEINTGVYCADSRFLRDALEQLKPNNAQREYYLPATLAQTPPN